ncbi:MAG TPA: hypothetical protein QF700_00310 [Prochlorococcus sp.]|nr:hypothetical protein [Prochlorococcus sp.]
MTEWPYWVIFILFPLPVWIPYFKNLFEWMNGKDVKAFDDVIKRARARGKALEARKKSFKKWEKDEGNNFPPHLEIFDKDRK